MKISIARYPGYPANKKIQSKHPKSEDALTHKNIPIYSSMHAHRIPQTTLHMHAWTVVGGEKELKDESTHSDGDL